MSFNHYSRKVRNIQLSPWVRLAALRSCISQLSFLKGSSYNSLLAELNQKYGFDRYRDGTPDSPPNDFQLLATVEEIEEGRKIILEKLRSFDHVRKHNKILGNRQLSIEEREKLKLIRQ